MPVTRNSEGAFPCTRKNGAPFWNASAAVFLGHCSAGNGTPHCHPELSPWRRIEREDAGDFGSSAMGRRCAYSTRRRLVRYRPHGSLSVGCVVLVAPLQR